MRASSEDYKCPNKATDRVVTSYDGYSSHLLVIDGASRRVWAFLTKTKEPPLDILRAFMTKFGIGNGVVRTDQGGELARSSLFRDMMLRDFGYVVEPTGADSPSQNGGAEIYNNTLAVKVRTLLYGSGLPAKFWSAALLHAVYLHNRLVHSATNTTPYEGWYGRKPDVTHLKTFGSRVCVKRTGSRRCKLDRHDFTGIFLGYTATDQNIIYLDLESGIVKSCHHAVFDEAWYLQPTRPLAAQLLYDLGLEAEEDSMTMTGPLHPTPLGTIAPVSIEWPPQPTYLSCDAKPLYPPPLSLLNPLPLRITETPNPNAIAARAARLRMDDDHKSKSKSPLTSSQNTLLARTTWLWCTSPQTPSAQPSKRNSTSAKLTSLHIVRPDSVSLKKMAASISPPWRQVRPVRVFLAGVLVFVGRGSNQRHAGLYHLGCAGSLPTTISGWRILVHSTLLAPGSHTRHFK